MFTLTGCGIRNILFNTRLHNPAQLPAQLIFCPAQLSFFFPAPCQIRPAQVYYKQAI